MESDCLVGLTRLQRERGQPPAISPVLRLILLMLAVPFAFLGVLLAIAGEGPYWDKTIPLWIVAGILVLLAVLPYTKLKRGPG